MSKLYVETIDVILDNLKYGFIPITTSQVAILNKWLDETYDADDLYHRDHATRIIKHMRDLWDAYNKRKDDAYDANVEANITIEEAKETEEYYTKGQALYALNKETTDKIIKDFFDRNDEERQEQNRLYARSNILQLRRSEAMIDIAYNAGYHQFTTGDSREDVQLFKLWAYEFSEAWNYDDPNGDYINAIDEFYTQKSGKILLDKLIYKDDKELEVD